MMPIPNRDAVALSARTLGALFFMRRIMRKLRRWSPPSRTDGSSSGPSRSQPRWRQGLPHRLKKRCRKPGSACLSGHGPCRRRPGALSGWIKSLCCLAITLALRQWMRENGIALEADGNEPEDRFGTVLLLAAWLCETEQDALFAQLLAWHLLPWSGRFLSVFVDHAAHPFYQALGQLAQATLAQWQGICRSPWRKNRSIVNPSRRRYPARFYFAASQPFTRTYRFCI